MITLDTNVLVRAFANDDAGQSPTAQEFLLGLTDDEPGFITMTVIVELVWVLRRRLKLEADGVHRLLDDLMRTSAFEIEDSESVGEALEAARQGADFADALIQATSRLYGATETVTFDRDAATRFGWRLLG